MRRFPRECRFHARGRQSLPACANAIAATAPAHPRHRPRDDDRSEKHGHRASNATPPHPIRSLVPGGCRASRRRPQGMPGPAQAVLRRLARTGTRTLRRARTGCRRRSGACAAAGRPAAAKRGHRLFRNPLRAPADARRGRRVHRGTRIFRNLLHRARRVARVGAAARSGRTRLAGIRIRSFPRLVGRHRIHRCHAAGFDRRRPRRRWTGRSHRDGAHLPGRRAAGRRRAASRRQWRGCLARAGRYVGEQRNLRAGPPRCRRPGRIAGRQRRTGAVDPPPGRFHQHHGPDRRRRRGHRAGRRHRGGALELDAAGRRRHRGKRLCRRPAGARWQRPAGPRHRNQPVERRQRSTDPLPPARVPACLAGVVPGASRRFRHRHALLPDRDRQQLRLRLRRRRELGNPRQRDRPDEGGRRRRGGRCRRGAGDPLRVRIGVRPVRAPPAPAAFRGDAFGQRRHYRRPAVVQRRDRLRRRRQAHVGRIRGRLGCGRAQHRRHAEGGDHRGRQHLHAARFAARCLRVPRGVRPRGEFHLVPQWPRRAVHRELGRLRDGPVRQSRQRRALGFRRRLDIEQHQSDPPFRRRPHLHREAHRPRSRRQPVAGLHAQCRHRRRRRQQRQWRRHRQQRVPLPHPPRPGLFLALRHRRFDPAGRGPRRRGRHGPRRRRRGHGRVAPGRRQRQRQRHAAFALAPALQPAAAARFHRHAPVRTGWRRPAAGVARGNERLCRRFRRRLGARHAGFGLPARGGSAGAPADLDPAVLPATAGRRHPRRLVRALDHRRQRPVAPVRFVHLARRVRLRRRLARIRPVRPRRRRSLDQGHRRPLRAGRARWPGRLGERLRPDAGVDPEQQGSAAGAGGQHLRLLRLRCHPGSRRNRSGQLGAHLRDPGRRDLHQRLGSRLLGPRVPAAVGERERGPSATELGAAGPRLGQPGAVQAGTHERHLRGGVGRGAPDRRPLHRRRRIRSAVAAVRRDRPRLGAAGHRHPRVCAGWRTRLGPGRLPRLHLDLADAAVGPASGARRARVRTGFAR